MTCADVEQLQDAFVDAELPGPMLLAIARHAGACTTCDEALRELGTMREVVEQAVQRDADQLDLSRLWPAVAAEVERDGRQRTWRSRMRVMPAWGAVAALAAGTVFWLQSPVPGPEPVRVAARPRPNQAVIERLSAGSSSRVSLRRERKNGTTLIMVRANADEVLR